MPDLSGLDFYSGAWKWFICIPTVLGIVWMAWFAVRLSKRQPGQKLETMGHVWDQDLEEYNNPLPRWWLNLFYITLVWGVLYLLFYPGLTVFEGLKKWTQYKQYDEEIAAANAKFGPIFERFHAQDVATLATNPEALTIGQRLYSTYCTQCHGSDARGARGYPNLTDTDWLWGGAPERIEETILNGRTGAMPGWGPMLTAEKIHDVTEYVVKLSGRPADATTAARGQEVFTQTCAACHGADGKGNPTLGAPNLTDDIWLYGGSQARLKETITNGRQGNMPAHKEFLGEAKARLLAAYVYSLSRPAEATATGQEPPAP
jgi:cytochrome c oxidase cbb3-type subunit 3